MEQKRIMSNKLPGRVAVIYLTPTGKGLAERLTAGWNGESVQVLAAGSSLSEQVPLLWKEYDNLIFIMAVGIVVRLIAPLIKSKWDDPGVVVVDEGGHFAVSLLGGHWGGSNNLARQVASVLGAVSVVTTATDVQGKPAIDSLARSLGMIPLPKARVKQVNSALLAGKRVVLYTEWDLKGLVEETGIEVLPLERYAGEPGGVPVFVTSRDCSLYSTQGIFLCPASLTAGIGCKRGVSAEEVISALTEALKCAGRHPESLSFIASHVAKANEMGLREAVGQMHLPLAFYGAEVLQKIHKQNPGLADSCFVREQMGVGGVCETAALAAAAKGKLVLSKTKVGRVTVALAEAGLLWSASGQAIRRN